ncbi:FecR family protein [bacterium]|nr:FecR family protein [bacterium]
MSAHDDNKDRQLGHYLERLGEAWAGRADASDEFVARFEARLTMERTRPSARILSVPGLVRWSAAAATTIAACIALIFVLTPIGDGRIGAVAYGQGDFAASGSKSQARLVGNSSLITGEDGRAMATLDDERVALFIDQNSSIRLNSEEKVNLTRGRVWISVEPNSGFFAVETPDCVVEVKGTTFGVEIGENGTEVALASGEVWLAQGKHFTRMSAGSIAKIAKDSEPELMRANGDLVPTWALDLYANAEAARAAEFFPSAAPGVRGRPSR